MGKQEEGGRERVVVKSNMADTLHTLTHLLLPK